MHAGLLMRLGVAGQRLGLAPGRQALLPLLLLLLAIALACSRPAGRGGVALQPVWHSWALDSSRQKHSRALSKSLQGRESSGVTCEHAVSWLL